MSLPGRQRRALDRIAHGLVADDPGLCMRFEFFTTLTRQETMPKIEYVPGRRERFVRRAVLLPLLTVVLVALVAASWRTPSAQPCSAGLRVAAGLGVAAAGLSPATGAARCQAGPPINPAAMPAH